MAAARTIAEWATALELDDVPEAVRTDAKLHLLDTIGCGLAAHATGVAHEGRTTMAELGGVAEATVIGTTARLPAPNAAFANAMLCHGLDYDDTHSDSVSHVSTVICPTALSAAESLGASGRDTLTAIVAGNEVVCRVGMAAPGAFHARGFHPTAICGIFGGVATVVPPRPRRRDDHDERPRHRRLVRGRPLRVPRRGHADEAHAPRVGVARRPPRDAPRGARRRGPVVGARGEVRPLPRVRRRGGGRGRHRRSAARPREPLGDAANRVQALPGVPLHARRARRGDGGGSGPDVRAGRDRRRARVGPRGRRVARPRARAGEDDAAVGVRGQVLPAVLDRVAARARARLRRGLHGRGDRRPGRARRRPEGALRDARRTPPTRRRSRAEPSSAWRTGRRSRPTTRTSAAGPRARSRTTRCARSSATTPRSRSPTRRSRRSRTRFSRSRSWTTSRRRSLRSRSRRPSRREPDRRAGRDRGGGAGVRRPRRRARRLGARARGRVPRVDGRDDARDGAVRDDDPRGVRRSRPRARHVRADRDGALARLGDAVGDPQRLLHRRDDDPAPRDGGAATDATCRGSPRWSSARRSR